MHKFSLALTALIAVVAPVTTASAQNAHTWVSSAGTANASCQFVNPCLNFTQALAATNPGGEISCFTSGQFGSLTVSQSLTIDCNQVNATMQLLTISGTAATDVVVIRGIDFDLSGLTNATMNPGVINFIGAGALYLENVKVNNLRGNQTHGINFVPGGAALLRVANSTIANMGTSGIIAGIYIKPASGVVAKVNVENSRVHHNMFGIVADGSLGGTVQGAVSNSNVSENVNNGITVANGSSVSLLVKETTVANNSFGLVAGGGAGMLVSRSAIVSNATGLFASGGTLFSYGNNEVNANTTSDGAFTNSISVK
jgi:hypothetical protein